MNHFVDIINKLLFEQSLRETRIYFSFSHEENETKNQFFELNDEE
jgi:hypothetical protein